MVNLENVFVNMALEPDSGESLSSAGVANLELVDIFYGEDSLIPSQNAPSGSSESRLDSLDNEDDLMRYLSCMCQI